MQTEAEERWQMLSELPAKEQDPGKLLELLAAIDRLLLEEKFEQIARQRPEKKDGTAA